MDNSENIIPFLKWAGGKRWLILKHRDLFPAKYNKYIEPFLGSGAVFFYLKPEASILNDLNKDLIQTYLVLKEDWTSVRDTLESYQKKHCEDFYYQMRAKKPRCDVKKAARFIYLNRTCWNGLYRVNKEGKFNVPIGTKKNVILDTDNFELIAKRLQNVEFMMEDFEIVLSKAERGDFVFIDPPYTVKHNLNGFVKYNDKLFSWEDQVRLKDCVESAVLRGVKVLLTNANHESIRKLYQGIGKHEYKNRLSFISGKSNARGKYSELIVRSYVN